MTKRERKFGVTPRRTGDKHRIQPEWEGFVCAEHECVTRCARWMDGRMDDECLECDHLTEG